MTCSHNLQNVPEFNCPHVTNTEQLKQSRNKQHGVNYRGKIAAMSRIIKMVEKI